MLESSADTGTVSRVSDSRVAEQRTKNITMNVSIRVEHSRLYK